MPKTEKTERTPTGFQLPDDATADAEAHATEAREAAQAWSTGYGKLIGYVRTVAQHVFAIRQLFTDTKTGNPDWYGTSQACRTYIGANVYAPVFGDRPKGDATEVAAWRRDSGYGSFATTLSREMDVLISQAQADGIMPVAEAKTSDTKDRRTPLRKVADDILDLAKNTGRSEAPPVVDLLQSALFFTRTAANVMTADDYKLTAPTKVRGLENQLQLELERINAAIKAATETAATKAATKNSNRSGRTGRKAA